MNRLVCCRRPGSHSLATGTRRATHHVVPPRGREKSVGWFDTDFRHAAEDADFLARLGEDKPIAYVREVVSHYRLGHSALTGNLVRTEAARIQLWLKHLDRIGLRKPELRDRLHHRLLTATLRLEECRQKKIVDADVDVAQLISSDAEPATRQAPTEVRLSGSPQNAAQAFAGSGQELTFRRLPAFVAVLSP